MVTGTRGLWGPRAAPLTGAQPGAGQPGTERPARACAVTVRALPRLGILERRWAAGVSGAGQRNSTGQWLPAQPAPWEGFGVQLHQPVSAHSTGPLQAVHKEEDTQDIDTERSGALGIL